MQHWRRDENLILGGPSCNFSVHAVDIICSAFVKLQLQPEIDENSQNEYAL